MNVVMTVDYKKIRICTESNVFHDLLKNFIYSYFSLFYNISEVIVCSSVTQNATKIDAEVHIRTQKFFNAVVKQKNMKISCDGKSIPW